MNIESLSRQLDPDIDLWHTAKRHLERWMKNQVGILPSFANLKVQDLFGLKNYPIF